MRNWVPEIGWPVYDLRRRRFGICIEKTYNPVEEASFATVHIEGDRWPVEIYPHMNEYEYPKFYINDEVRWLQAQNNRWKTYDDMDGFFIKHVHYHVPRDTWEYTIAKQGMEGFDRHVIKGHAHLFLLQRFVPKI